jgi:hypothetical protein
MYKIWRVGHEDDGYSFILTIAPDSAVAIAHWRLEYAGETRKREIEEGDEHYVDIWRKGPDTVEELGHTVSLDDGGLKLER